MKTVITSSGNELKSNFDLRFGRAAYFCIYDEESKETSFFQNDNTLRHLKHLKSLITQLTLVTSLS